MKFVRNGCKSSSLHCSFFILEQSSNQGKLALVHCHQQVRVETTRHHRVSDAHGQARDTPVVVLIEEAFSGIANIGSKVTNYKCFVHFEASSSLQALDAFFLGGRGS